MYRHRMPYVPGGYGQVIHSFNLSGDQDPMAITYGLSVVTTFPTPTDAQTIAANLHTEFTTRIVTPLMSNAYTCTQTEIQLVQTSGTAPQVYVSASAVVGGSTSPVAPQNTAFLIQKRTAKSGRRGRGRFYLPGVQETNVDAAGQVLAAHLSTANSAFAGFLTAANNIVGVDDLVLLHQLTPPATNPATLPAPDKILSLIMDSRVATQRRRLRK